MWDIYEWMLLLVVVFSYACIDAKPIGSSRRDSNFREALVS